MRASFSDLDQGICSLKENLVCQLPALVSALFPGRPIQKSVHEYRVGTKGSLVVRALDGAYFDHEVSLGGDIFHLIQNTLKIDFKGAVLFAHSFVGSDFRRVLTNLPKFAQKTNERAVKQREKALAILKRSQSLKSTLAEDYLHLREIRLPEYPKSLGFVSHVYNYTGSRFYPALVATIQNLEGDAIAAHCTFLNGNTKNKLQGKDVKSRLIFGSCKGGAIRLAEATDRVALCEGIEDGLSIMQCSDWPVWATGGTSNLRSVRIPTTVKEVMICSDNDDAGKQASKELSQKLSRDGIKVRIAMPPEGTKDFNDLLRMEQKS